MNNLTIRPWTPNLEVDDEDECDLALDLPEDLAATVCDNIMWLSCDHTFTIRLIVFGVMVMLEMCLLKGRIFV